MLAYKQSCETFIENNPAFLRMDSSEAILKKLSQGEVVYAIVVDGKKYTLKDVSVSKTKNPIKDSTSRGNVYIEKSQSYRILASVDPQLSQVLSSTMLGPSSEFGGLHIEAELASGKIEIIGSLLSMARSDGVARLQIAVADILQ